MMTRHQFTPPAAKARLDAIGPRNHLPALLRRALEPGEDFAPIPVPGPDDWLLNHPEEGQSFEAFLRSRPHRPDVNRPKVYLQPLGQFIPSESPSLERLKAFASAFFPLEVNALRVLDIAGSGVTQRQNPYSHNRQLLTTDILALLRRQLPRDAYALLGITMDDLYPDPTWNFVFGQASLRERVGVYSFARYHPRFNREAVNDFHRLLLQRSCKVLAHEMSHMFGIQHCIYFHCLMNGSNHLVESDARPMHLCPVDLRKLQESIGFDVVERYRNLLAFNASVQFLEEAEWLRRRLELITGALR